MSKGKKKPRVPKYPANPDALRIVTSFSRPMPEQSALEKYNKALVALERLHTVADDKQTMADMQLMGGAYNVALELLPVVGLGGNETAGRVIDAWGEVIHGVCNLRAKHGVWNFAPVDFDALGNGIDFYGELLRAASQNQPNAAALSVARKIAKIQGIA